jgi:hypothetical protein
MFAIPLLLLHALITARAERLAATFEATRHPPAAETS